MDVDLLRWRCGGHLAQAVTSSPKMSESRKVPPKTPVLRTGEPTLAAPQQARSIEKRSKLLATGRLLFGEKGYEATSIGDITSKAGTASGAFYQYFSSKRDFLVALMNEFLGQLGSVDLRPKGGADIHDGLYEFLRAAFRVDVQYFGVVRAWQEAVLADAGLAKMQEEVERWTGARVLGVFQMLQQHPNARPDRDLPTFARMMDRHFWSLLARGSRMSPQDFDREIKVSADVIYDYLFRNDRHK
jgi:AcrR family transcriptional regulator